MARNDWDELEENPHAKIFLDQDDPRLSPLRPAKPQQPADDAFFADPFAGSSDYLPSSVQQPETGNVQRGDFARSQGSEVVSPDMQAAAPVFGAEEVTSAQAPVTRATMGTEFFEADNTPDLTMLAPAAPKEITADQQRDAEMGWGAGGSVLVRAAEERDNMDRARRQADALRASGEVLIAAVQKFDQQDMARAASMPGDPNSSISQRLSGGQANREPAPQEGTTTAASRIISQRLAGALAPQSDNASVTSPKPQREGWSR